MESSSDLPTGAAPRAVRTPTELPFEHTDLPALGGQIGPEPEDFVVDELPLYSASGQGDHWYVRLGKRERTTPELRAAVAEVAGVPEREIGHAGLKDKHAVTTQWLSVPVARATPPAAWRLPAPFTLLEVSRHGNKLRVGHLSGNRFRIRLVKLAPGALSAVGPLCQRITEQGIGNYFGPQRFGVGQRNLETALSSLERRRLGPRAGQRGKFLASVIQSEIFNRYVTLRFARGRDQLLEGEVVRLSGSRALFEVEDPVREASRLRARDIVLTGPLIGPKMKESRGEPLTLEQAAVAAVGLSAAGLRDLGRAAPGTRRDLVSYPEGLTWQEGEGASLSVEFSLPAGAYASLVIRCLTRQDPWAGAGGDGDPEAAGGELAGEGRDDVD